MKKFLDIPAIWRVVNNPLPISSRLNATIGLNVWRPRNVDIFLQKVVAQR